MHYNPPFTQGHHYIIVIVNYFTKWIESMPTCINDGNIVSLFFFNHVIARFGVPKFIVTEHGKHFQNHMMQELVAKLGFRHENFSPYYPQANGQIEVINRTLKTMLQRIVGNINIIVILCYFFPYGHNKPQ